MHRTYEQKNLIKQADPLGWNVRGIRTPPPPSPPGIMKFIYFFVKNYPISSPWKNWAYALIVKSLFPPGKFSGPPTPHLLKRPILTYLTLHTGRSNTMPR